MSTSAAIPGPLSEILKHTRVDRIADYLRGCLQRGDLSSPLPSTRVLSERLGVGRASLEQALKILEGDGLLEIRPRKGIVLVPSISRRESLPAVRTIRWVWHKKNLSFSPMLKEIFFLTAERLRANGINSIFENGSMQNIKAIHREGPKKHELLFLVSIDPELQQLFSNFDRHALLIGLPEPGSKLPFVSVDIFSALRHAINSSVTRGFKKVSLLVSGYIPSELKINFDTVCKKEPNLLKEICCKFRIT
jgi:DNA-binding transcriptional ArsR family regulator